MNRIGEHGEEILKTLKTTRSQIFTDQALTKESVREVYNHLLMDMERFELAFYTNCRFISGPTVPVRHVRPSRAAIVIAAFLGSLAFFLASAFVSTWWGKNKERILAGNPD